MVVTTLILVSCGNGDGDAGAQLAEPESGATVSSPFQVVMTAEGIDIVPAAEPAEGEGHFHIMVDVGCLTHGEVIPSDDQHLHFGDASTEATLELAPGQYSLCLQVGDGAHVALDLTDEIIVTVE